MKPQSRYQLDSPPARGMTFAALDKLRIPDGFPACAGSDKLVIFLFSDNLGLKGDLKIPLILPRIRYGASLLERETITSHMGMNSKAILV
ncbi:MAG: hypothetical protein HYX79_10615 [Chloroflexi bacterium]|nr:hypothetical protein [Chloroflexota bacterium]